jgi:hypothetical protein
MADTALAQDPRPPAKVQTESYRKERPSIVGPDTPEAPFPIQLAGDVQRGFGRGGKDLGCPTGMYTVFQWYIFILNLCYQPTSLTTHSRR